MISNHTFLFLYINIYIVFIGMKSLNEFIIEKYDWNSVFKNYSYKPFASKEELNAYLDEVEKTKQELKKYENEAEKYWQECRKLDEKINNQLRKEKLGWKEEMARYDELKKEYGYDEIMQKAKEVMKQPQVVELNKRFYTDLQECGINSLTKQQAKKMQSRGGFMYNLLIEIMKVYTNWDYKKNKPVE